jgi:hypothetical protein
MDQFDPNFPGYIEGAITAVKVVEPGSITEGLPNRVVDPSKDFTVRVVWNVFGVFTPLWIAALDNPWVVSVYGESMAAGPERLIGKLNVDKANFAPDPTPGHVNGRVYTADVIVPANTLPEGDPDSQISGIYKLVTSVFLDSTLGTPGFDMIGFSEGPFVQVENPI